MNRTDTYANLESFIQWPNCLYPIFITLLQPIFGMNTLISYSASSKWKVVIYSTMNLGFYCICNFAMPTTKLIRQMLATYQLHSEYKTTSPTHFFCDKQASVYVTTSYHKYASFHACAAWLSCGSGNKYLSRVSFCLSCDFAACSEKRIGMANQFSSSELEEIRVQFDQVYT